MRILRNRWQRTALHRYLQDLPPLERQTFWIVSALAIAFGVAFGYLAHAQASTPPADPWFELPDVVTRFAELGGRT